MAVIIIAVTWRWAGYNAIIILAGLQSIPEDVYEAATLDRVSKLRQFFFITLPLLKPIIVFCVVLSIIGTMQLFAEPFLITNRGGPGGGTETLGLLLYRQGFTVAQFRLRLGRSPTPWRGWRSPSRCCNLLAGEGTEMRRSRPPQLRRAASRCTLFLAPLALIWLFPLWMMLVFSTMPDNGIFSPGIELLPHDQFRRQLQQSAARHRFRRRHRASRSRWRVTYTFLSVLLTSMAGWALARYRFFGKGVVVAIILGTITLPYFVVVIPQFIMVARDFNLANTWVALIVPPLFNSLGVLFMRQTFSMMPGELFDAARVEGVKEWRIFLYVALPLARPTLAALAIILFLHSWNNYLWPLLINSQARR